MCKHLPSTTPPKSDSSSHLSKTAPDNFLIGNGLVDGVRSFWFVFCLFVLWQGFLCSPGWSITHDHLASVFWVLESTCIYYHTTPKSYPLLSLTILQYPIFQTSTTNYSLDLSCLSTVSEKSLLGKLFTSNVNLCIIHNSLCLFCIYKRTKSACLRILKIMVCMKLTLVISKCLLN